MEEVHDGDRNNEEFNNNVDNLDTVVPEKVLNNVNVLTEYTAVKFTEGCFLYRILIIIFF